MSTHPSTHHEIAQLRHEERLVRAALATRTADMVRSLGSWRLERLLGTVRARLDAQRGVTAIRALYH